jgi:hypothetical protein
MLLNNPKTSDASISADDNLHLLRYQKQIRKCKWAYNRSLQAVF